MQKRDSGTVSPGPLAPKAYSQRVAHSGDYLLPHYISAFILATNVSFYFSGLGSWDYSVDNDNNTVINTLMKYAYAPVLSGGLGPFSFEAPAGYDHNYQLKRKNGGLLLTLPGGQVIGYVLRTIPKFPENQTQPTLNVTECDEITTSPSPTNRRRRRSVPEEDSNTASDIRKLARTLFSEELVPPPREHVELIKDSKVVSSEYIQELIKSGEMKQEQLTKFVQSIDKKAGTINSTIAYE